MMRNRFWLFGALFLMLAISPASNQATALLEPSDPTGTTCKECGIIVFEIGGVEFETIGCVPARSAAPLSGRTCTVVGERCKISDWCQYA